MVYQGEGGSYFIMLWVVETEISCSSLDKQRCHGKHLWDTTSFLGFSCRAVGFLCVCLTICVPSTSFSQPWVRRETPIFGVCIFRLVSYFHRTQILKSIILLKISLCCSSIFNLRQLKICHYLAQFTLK